MSGSRFSQSSFETNSEGFTEIELKPPGKYRVILLNDHYTTMDFVVGILVGVFHKKKAEAIRIMYDVHRSGRGIAGVYTKEIAETKIAIVHAMAQKEGHPMKCILEPDL